LKATANSVLRQHAEGLWKGAYAGVALCLFIFAVHARLAPAAMWNVMGNGEVRSGAISTSLSLMIFSITAQ